MAQNAVEPASLAVPNLPDMDEGFLAFAAKANTTSNATAAAFASTPGTATTFHPAAPRLPTGQPGCPIPLDATIAASPVAQAYPDEYIFDGGDRDHPVHYYGGEMEGLDTEDTVAEFKDHLGKNHVQPSNRVAVYAPRFGAVETVSGLKMDIKLDKAIGSDNLSGFGSLHEERGLDEHVRNSVASGFATRRSASGMDTAQPPHATERVDNIASTNKVDQSLMAHNRTGFGRLETSDTEELTIQILKPSTSAADTNIAQRQTIKQATLTYSTFKPAATVGMEKGGRKGQILITKEASPLIAQQGDIVTFEIHFSNPGDYNVQEVRIIDNLTPRLIYVDGTGEIQVVDNGGGSLTVVPNKEGSQTLIFELDEPLRGGESGSITFQAKVR